MNEFKAKHINTHYCHIVCNLVLCISLYCSGNTPVGTFFFSWLECLNVYCFLMVTYQSFPPCGHIHKREELGDKALSKWWIPHLLARLNRQQKSPFMAIPAKRTPGSLKSKDLVWPSQVFKGISSGVRSTQILYLKEAGLRKSCIENVTIRKSRPTR